MKPSPQVIAIEEKPSLTSPFFFVTDLLHSRIIQSPDMMTQLIGRSSMWLHTCTYINLAVKLLTPGLFNLSFIFFYSFKSGERRKRSI